MSFHLVLFWLPLSQAVHERKLLLFWLLLLLPPSCALLVSSLCSHPVDCIVYDAAAPGAAPMLLPLLLLLLSGTASSSPSQTQLLSQSRHIVVITAICKWQRFLSPSHPLSLCMLPILQQLHLNFNSSYVPSLPLYLFVLFELRIMIIVMVIKHTL